MSLQKNFLYRSFAKKDRQSKYKINAHHFDIFVEECKYWLQYFGLAGWEVDFAMDDSDECRAWCFINTLEDRVAQIGLSTTFDIAPTVKVIRRSAFHEVVELLTMRFFVLAIDREAKVTQIEEENHNLVRTLENSVFELDYNLRCNRRKSK